VDRESPGFKSVRPPALLRLGVLTVDTSFKALAVIETGLEDTTRLLKEWHPKRRPKLRQGAAPETDRGARRPGVFGFIFA